MARVDWVEMRARLDELNNNNNNNDDKVIMTGEGRLGANAG